MADIRDMRRTRWFFVDNDLIDRFLPKMGASAFAVYAVLCRMAGNKTQDCWPSHATISAKTGLSVNTIRAGLIKLEELGLLAVEQRLRDDGSQTSNLYTLLEPPAEIEEALSDSGTGPGYNSGTPAPYQKLMTNYPNPSELSLNEGDDKEDRPDAMAIWNQLKPLIAPHARDDLVALMQPGVPLSVNGNRLLICVGSAITAGVLSNALEPACRAALADAGHPGGIQYVCFEPGWPRVKPT